MTTVKKTKTAASQKKIIAKNVKFKKATAAERRVMIAKDVITALEQKTIRSVSGNWVKTHDQLFKEETLDKFWDGDAKIIETIEKTQISDAIKNVKCDVCALGALFVCGVRRFNKITFGKLSDEVFGGTEAGEFEHEHLDYFLKGYFSESQLSLIEIAFEKGMGAYIATSNKENLAMRMFKGSPKIRMIGIMKNIIKNKGQFIPEL